jgi:hypothetical protein
VTLTSATIELFYSGAWQDITSYVYDRDPIVITRSQRPEGSAADPGALTLTINNRDGRFSPRNPTSPLYRLIGRNTPIRVTIAGSVRFVGEVTSWPQRWDVKQSDVWVPLEAAGIRRRAGASTAQPLQSAIRRWYLGLGGDIQLIGYWPLEDTSQAGSAIPGASLIPYAGGDVAPGWGADMGPGGSAPLPAWPVVDEFGWAAGGRVNARVAGPWSVRCITRVPSGAGAATLMQWRTTGGSHTEWSVGVTDTGVVRVTASPSEGSALTFDSLATVDDGEWHSLAVNVSDNDSGVVLDIEVDDTVRAIPATTIEGAGNPTEVRPRPQYVDSTDQDPIGLGHAAVLAIELPSGVLFPLHLLPPIDGFSGEQAVARIARLAGESRINVDLGGQTVGSDAFTRTETGGWGAADPGGEWDTIGLASDFSVDGSEGHIAESTEDEGRFAVLSGDVANVDATVAMTFGSDARGDGKIVARFVDEDNHYGFTLDSPGVEAPDLRIGRLVGGTFTTLVRHPFTTTVGQKYVVRAVALGDFLAAKVWEDGNPEPAGWMVTAHDTSHTTGQVGCAAFSYDAGDALDVAFDDFAAIDVGESTRLGPQQIATLDDNLQQAADADHGLLGESRGALGYAYRSRRSLYGQAAVGVDYDGGEVAPPWHPEEDDQQVANRVTVERIGGSSITAELDNGALSTQDPPNGVGIYPRSVRLNVESDLQLPDHASWLLTLGTWDEARYPQLTVDLRRLAEVAQDTDLRDAVLALDFGDRVDVLNPPEWLPPDTVRLLILGSAETATLDEHKITFNCAPYGPYVVGERADGAPGQADPVRRDTAGSELASQFVAGTGTTMSVAVTQGPLWASSGAANLDLPLLVECGGAALKVTAIAGTSSPQTFTVDATVVNGVEKTIAAGTPVRLWQPAARGL